MDNLKLTLVQPDLVWEDFEGNFNNYEKLFRAIDQTDLIVLPEMFATGFTMNESIWNLDSNKKILDWLCGISERFSCAVMASTGFCQDGMTFNRLFLIKGKNIVKYDKRHLFSPGNEVMHYKKGSERILFELNGWKILPQVCYDVRFPVWSRNDLGYDVIINVANWPSERQDHWETLLKARAIENQTYAIGVNRIGSDENGIDYLGLSQAYSFDGKLICKMKESKEDVLTINVSKQKMLDYRSKLNFLADRDDFEIKK